MSRNLEAKSAPYHGGYAICPCMGYPCLSYGKPLRESTPHKYGKLLGNYLSPCRTEDVWGHPLSACV